MCLNPWGQGYSNTKTRQRHHTQNIKITGQYPWWTIDAKIPNKILANKILQQKNRAQYSSRIFPRDTRMVQYAWMQYIIQQTMLTKIKNKNTWSHNSKDAGKAWQNSSSYDKKKTSQQNGNRGNVPQLNNGHIWQSHS